MFQMPGWVPLKVPLRSWGSGLPFISESGSENWFRSANWTRSVTFWGPTVHSPHHLLLISSGGPDWAIIILADHLFYP